MSYPQPDLQWIPANAANFMVGRQGTPIRKVTYHHIVGSAASAISKFQQASQVSAHFIVAPNAIYCMVDTDDTAYCNANWPSNLESVTIEHEGTWLNGFRNEDTINNSARLTAWLRTLYPSATPNRHRDVYATACPGDLPVEEIWNKASLLLNPPAPLPPPQPEWLKNRTPLVTTKYANKGNIQLWNLTNPGQPADARTFPLNTKFDIGSQTSVGGQNYFITVYSTGKNVPAGYKASDLSDAPYVEPLPPVTPPPVVEPPKPPTVPKDEEQDQRLNAIEKLLKTITDFLSSIFSGFKK